MVELVNYFGDDTMVVDVARVSFDKIASEYSDLENEKLIRYLYKNKHTSPFRHPQLQFRVSCPIYVERQIFKHQVGINVNSISGRYVDFSDEYYEIQEWRGQSKSSKQGSEGLVDNQQRCLDIQSEIISICADRYNELISLGVAKEQARTILPLNLVTKFMWTGSLLAFKHLCDLRIKSDAQQETREVVIEMLNQVKNIGHEPFKISLDAFGHS